MSVRERLGECPRRYGEPYRGMWYALRQGRMPVYLCEDVIDRCIAWSRAFVKSLRTQIAIMRAVFARSPSRDRMQIHIDAGGYYGDARNHIGKLYRGDFEMMRTLEVQRRRGMHSLFEFDRGRRKVRWVAERIAAVDGLHYMLFNNDVVYQFDRHNVRTLWLRWHDVRDWPSWRAYASAPTTANYEAILLGVLNSEMNNPQ